MLKQRVITALILLALLLPALFSASYVPFCALTLLLIAAGAWEWARLNGCGQAASIGLGVAALLFCAGMWSAGFLSDPLPRLWSVVGGAWVLGSAWLLRRGVAAWSGYPQALRLGLGFMAIVLAWLAMAQARVIGPPFLLSILALVWAADIFAYAAGRTLGGRFFRNKLAPSVSPGKSWEGVCGGAVGVVALALVWWTFDATNSVAIPSWYSHMAKAGWPLLLLSVVLMTAMSVVGDLLESLVKRSAGVKDSSGLLPGHGGVLDRVDALLPALPLAMMLYTSLPW